LAGFGSSAQQQQLVKLNVRTITLADVDIEVSDEVTVWVLCSIALWHLWRTWRSVSGVAFINCDNCVLFAALCPSTPQIP